VIRRWHHGHSTLVGVVIGVLLTRHGWLLFGLGIGCGVFLAYLRQTAAWFADKVSHWRHYGPSRRQHFSDGPVPVYRTRGSGPSDEIPY
jgi:hypothetical protein